MADLIVSFSELDFDRIYYALSREASLNLDATMGDDYAVETLEKMKGI